MLFKRTRKHNILKKCALVETLGLLSKRRQKRRDAQHRADGERAHEHPEGRRNSWRKDVSQLFLRVRLGGPKTKDTQCADTRQRLIYGYLSRYERTET